MADYLAIADRMPADLNSVYMRGFPGYMDMDKIRNFFMKNGGRCSFAFHKKSHDGNNLFLALRFDDQKTAQEVLRRYDDRNILGHRIQMQYFKDHQQAKEIADDYRRQEGGRRFDRHPPRRGHMDAARPGHHMGGGGRLSDLRSDLNLNRVRPNGGHGRGHRRQLSNPRMMRHRAPESNYESDYDEQNERRDERISHPDTDDLHSDDDRRHHRRRIRRERSESTEDDGRARQVHPPRSPSCSPPASPESSENEDEERATQSRSRERYNGENRSHHKHRHPDRRDHHRHRRRSRRRSDSRSSSPRKKHAKLRSESREPEPSVSQEEVMSTEEDVNELPQSPHKDSLSNTPILNLDVSNSSVGNGVNSSVSPSMMEAIVSKKVEAVKKYQEQCESIASVANMFIREDPSAEKTIQTCMTATLRRLADTTVKEVDEFVKRLSQKV